MNNESEWIWKEAAVAWSTYTGICMHRMRKTTKNLRTGSVTAEILTVHVPYTSQERYHYTKPTGEYDILKVLTN